MKKLLSILFLLAATTTFAFAVDYSYNQQQEGIVAHWTRDDMCGVFTQSNTEIIHWTTAGGSNTCPISAYGWSLSPNSQYYAYFPFSQSYTANKNPMTALPISYAEQLQTGNNTTAHLAAFDFMTAQATTTADDCLFSFLHHGSVLRIETLLDSRQTVTSLTFSSKESLFATKAEMNAVTGTLKPTEYSSAITLNLKDVTIEKGETLVAYMMMLPTDLEDKTLEVTLTTADGKTLTAFVKGTRITAGHVYPITLEMMNKQSINKTYKTDAQEYKYNKLDLLTSEPQNLKASAPSIVNSITAYIPDFTADSNHRFQQIENNETSIGNITASTTNSNNIYSINGIRISSPSRQSIIIRNGKKYLNR